MTDLYILSNPDCTSCKDSKNVGRYLNSGKIYGDNIFNIVDSFDVNKAIIGSSKFFGYSIAEYGELVYKVDGIKTEVQKIEFSNSDTLYVSIKGDKTMLGVA